MPRAGHRSPCCVPSDRLTSEFVWLCSDRFVHSDESGEPTQEQEGSQWVGTTIWTTSSPSSTSCCSIVTIEHISIKVCHYALICVYSFYVLCADKEHHQHVTQLKECTKFFKEYLQESSPSRSSNFRAASTMGTMGCPSRAGNRAAGSESRPMSGDGVG